MNHRLFLKKHAPDKDLATKSKELQESTVETESFEVSDIGNLVTSVMTVAEIEDTLHELSANVGKGTMLAVLGKKFHIHFSFLYTPVTIH